MSKENGKLALFASAVPSVILWSITRACNMACRHCHTVGKPAKADDELSTAEALALMDQFGSCGVHCVIFTGGEPLMRRDLLDVARHAIQRDLDLWLITNGWLVSEPIAREIAGIGFSRVLVSLDSARPERHDAFRNMPGCFDRATTATSRLLEAGARVALIVTINRMNFDEINDILALARRLEVNCVNFQTFKPTRASKTQTWDGQPMNLTPDEWRVTLERLLRLQAKVPDMTLDIGSGGHEPILSLYDPLGGNCLACDCGATLGSVEANGDVTLCIYTPDLIVGNLREDDLRTIWREAPVLRQLRTRVPRGKCRHCERFAQCGGGCPAVIWNTYGRFDLPDPNCWWRPDNGRERVI